MTKLIITGILTISKIYIYILKAGDHVIYEYLSNNYTEGEPIFLTDISIEGMSEENIRYHLKKLTDEGKISRYESGVYYLPQINIFGEKTVLSADTVALHKYVSRSSQTGKRTLPMCRRQSAHCADCGWNTEKNCRHLPGNSVRSIWEKCGRYNGYEETMI